MDNDTPQEQQEQQDSGGSILDNAKPAEQAEEVKYDFTGIVPEGQQYDEKSANEFAALCKEMGLSSDQANKLASHGMAYMGHGMEAAEAAHTAMINQWANDTRAKLGGDFDKTMSYVAVGRDSLEKQVPGLTQVLNESGLGNRYEVVKAIAEIGKLYSEDHGVGSNVQLSKPSSVYSKTDFNKYR